MVGWWHGPAHRRLPLHVRLLPLGVAASHAWMHRILLLVHWLLLHARVHALHVLEWLLLPWDSANHLWIHASRLLLLEWIN